MKFCMSVVTLLLAAAEVNGSQCILSGFKGLKGRHHHFDYIDQ